MRADCIGRTTKARRLRTRARWLCLLAGLFVVVCASWFGERESFAQSASSTADGDPVPVRPYPEQVNPAPANVVFIANRAVSSSSETVVVKSPSSEPAAPAPATAPTARQKELDAIRDPQKREILDQSANLLKLANSLKAEVDKTTEDTLSMTVVRQADEIEKLARKMRTK